MVRVETSTSSQILKIQSQMKKRPERTQFLLPLNILGETNGTVGWLLFILKNERKRRLAVGLGMLHLQASEQGEPPRGVPGTC